MADGDRIVGEVSEGPCGSVVGTYPGSKVWTYSIPCGCDEWITLSFKYNLNKDPLSLTDALHLVVNHRGDEVSMHCTVEQANPAWVLVGMGGVMDFIGYTGGRRCQFPWYGEVETWLREA